LIYPLLKEMIYVHVVQVRNLKTVMVARSSL